MDTWAAATLVHLGVTVWRFEALRTLAVKSILFIHTRASIPAGARRALIYFHITLCTWQGRSHTKLNNVFFFFLNLFFFFATLFYSLTSKARFAHTVKAVDAIFADAIVTRVTGTVVVVYLTVGAWGVNHN